MTNKKEKHSSNDVNLTDISSFAIEEERFRNESLDGKSKALGIIIALSLLSSMYLLIDGVSIGNLELTVRIAASASLTFVFAETLALLALKSSPDHIVEIDLEKYQLEDKAHLHRVISKIRLTLKKRGTLLYWSHNFFMIGLWFLACSILSYVLGV